MAEHHYDLVVLGGGSGGYAAAIRAVELGKRVALIEGDKVGGTCLHRGCVPTKAMLHAAEVADVVRHAESVGVNAGLDGFDPVRMRDFREGIVAKKFKGLQSLLATRGISTVAGFGRLEADRRVIVGDDTYIGENVILATGARTRLLPGIEVGGRILTSDEALALDEIPQRVIILGGGVIGSEFASMWRSLGAAVTIVEGLDHLVPAEDISLSKALERAFRKRGIAYSLGKRFQSATQSEDGVLVTLEDGKTLEGDILLVAVGRAPVTDGMGFEEAGVELERGFVRVDERLRTTAAGVWAVGDIVPGLQLAHRGFQQGIFVAEEIAGLNPIVVPDRSVPRITYSDPELASVGLTQAQAEEQYGADALATAEFNLAGNARSEILGTAGFAKVIRVKDGPIVGVHLAGARVGELITEGQLAVVWEAHPEDIAPYIHAHPTQSEALGEAFLALAGRPLHSL